MFSHVGIGAPTALRKSKAAFTAGVACGWKDAALTFALESIDPLIESSSRRQCDGSLTCVLRLRWIAVPRPFQTTYEAVRPRDVSPCGKKKPCSPNA